MKALERPVEPAFELTNGCAVLPYRNPAVEPGTVDEGDGFVERSDLPEDAAEKTVFDWDENRHGCRLMAKFRPVFVKELLVASRSSANDALDVGEELILSFIDNGHSLIFKVEQTLIGHLKCALTVELKGTHARVD